MLNKATYGILAALFIWSCSFIYIKALTYSQIVPQSTVLGDSTSTFYPYPTGTLVNDSGTVYFISGITKDPFTSWPAFIGLGYSSKNIVEGDLTNYTLASNYTINTANAAHPWGSWLIYKGTVYYVTQDGLIGVPSAQVFTSNGGDWQYIVKANKYDVAILNANPNLPLLSVDDSRIASTPSYGFGTYPAAPSIAPGTTTPIISSSQPTTTLVISPVTIPTTTPAGQNGTVNISTSSAVSTSSASSSPDIVNSLNYFLNTQGQTLTGTHPLSQTASGQTIYNVKWDNNSYETYSYDNSYIYLREDHSGSPNPGSYTFSDGKWMKLTMQVGDQINVSDNYIQNFTVNTSSCAATTSGAFPYVMTLLQHIPSDNLGGTLGTQDVIVLQYDYRNGTGTEYEKSYYAKGWGLVKWELYQNGQVIQSSVFNQISTAPPIAPNLQNACINSHIITGLDAPPAIPTTLNGFVNTLYSCVVQNNNPDTAGFNFWLQDLQNGSLNVKSIYTQFYNTQNSLNPPLSNDAFTKLLYSCALYRSVDTASYNNVMAGLANGTLTRSSLVQTVLNSAEFNTNILAKLQALLPTPSATATATSNPDVAALPASLSGFVSALYSCVLNNNNPDSSGFNFWLNNLQSGALTIQGAYTQFFGYQSGVVPTINNDQFTQKLYGCILFRPVDQTSYTNVMAGLANGSLTQASLVQTVLDSSEFTNGILPKLQALK